MRRFIILLAIPLIFACKDKMRDAGHIQIEAAVYHDPEGDLYNADLLQISDLYFIGQHFLEEVPYHNDSLNIPQYAYIKDGKFSGGQSLQEVLNSADLKPLEEKAFGAMFSPPPVPDYEKRESMSDTAFNGYNYKRLKIVNDSSYSVFYIHQTDTLMPFSLAPQVDKDYKGVLNRIDTYDKTNNRFVSLRMTVTDTIPKSFYEILINKK